ncbi:uncharacterized protein LOC122723815 [Manihot esculenta]|uniref:uncharacterized protein LOC122723815 n=1 Tax=Manihot esculenta TaxID=3983 RepID=UPI001CC5F233|nr:uncharacterized protein LOC122723815 [Manihot esculenta]
MFNERDRSCILNIPLSLSSCSDTWCWKFESKGHYSIKSAYRFLVDGFQHREGSEIWKRFWKAKVPPKVLNFCWRALVNVVPCLSSLQSKRVPVDPSCPLCHVAPENVLHILIQCLFARSCWLSSPLGWPAPSASSLNEWFSLAFSSTSVENASLMLMILWALWQNRNNVVWKGQGQTASGVFCMALNFLQQWKAARVVSSVSTIVDPVRPIWSPPPHGWIKANIDASLSLQRGSRILIPATWPTAVALELELELELGDDSVSCQKPPGGATAIWKVTVITIDAITRSPFVSFFVIINDHDQLCVWGLAGSEPDDSDHQLDNEGNCYPFLNKQTKALQPPLFLFMHVQECVSLVMGGSAPDKGIESLEVSATGLIIAASF